MLHMIRVGGDIQPEEPDIQLHHIAAGFSPDLFDLLQRISNETGQCTAERIAPNSPRLADRNVCGHD
ncbi:hypothetical protein ACRYCC_36155 [Actinomadura scrupuli]|uniref:hypothetical protein n=1 Tax=Actinomadura scrupuli TaxID=559629 RepID=UPI003D99B463